MEENDKKALDEAKQVAAAKTKDITKKMLAKVMKKAMPVVIAAVMAMVKVFIGVLIALTIYVSLTSVFFQRAKQQEENETEAVENIEIE